MAPATPLKMERVKRGWRQSDIEKLTQGGIPQNRYSLIERGIAPRPGEVDTLSKIFGLPPENLFPGGAQ